MATPPVPPPVPNPNKVPTAIPGPGMPPPPGAPGLRPPPNMQQKGTVDEAGPEEPGDYAERSFWQIPFVQDVLPFITSLLIHLGILGLGLLTYKTVQMIVTVSKEPVIIPDATIIENAEVGGIPHPGLGGDETRDAAQDKFKEIPPESTGIAEKPSSNLTMQLVGGGAGENDDSAIAVGASSSAFGKGKGAGSGTGDRIGAGTGDGSGALAPFGIPGGGGGIGPKSPFMGVSGNAHRIVYLCDATGTMMNVFDDLRVQLRKSIDVLKPIQSFNVLFFQDDSFLFMDKANLLPATPENKRKAYEFLEQSVARGSTNPIPAIRAAFAQNPQPQLIYVLTDGFDAVSSYQEVIDEFKKLNPQKKVKVNTIMIKASEEPELEKVLQTIANDNGGLFKIVRKQDMAGMQ